MAGTDSERPAPPQGQYYYVLIKISKAKSCGVVRAQEYDLEQEKLGCSMKWLSQSATACWWSGRIFSFNQICPIEGDEV